MCSPYIYGELNSNENSYASQDDRDSLYNKHTAMTPSSRQASLLSSYKLNLTTNITYDLDY